MDPGLGLFLDPQVPTRHWADLSEDDRRVYDELRLFSGSGRRSIGRLRSSTRF